VVFLISVEPDAGLSIGSWSGALEKKFMRETPS